MLQRVMSRFSVENNLSPSAGTLRRGTRHCFTKFPVSKNYRDKRGGVSPFSVKKVSVSQCRKSS